MKNNNKEVEKKEITIVGYNKNNMNRYSKQLKEVFGEYVSIAYFDIEEIKTKKDYFSDVVLFASYSLFEKMKDLFNEKCELVIFNRTISKKSFDTLKRFSSDEVIYIIDETQGMADEIAGMIKQLGISHLKTKAISKSEINNYDIKNYMSFTDFKSSEEDLPFNSFIDVNSLLEISIRLHLYGIVEEKRLIKEYENLVSSKMGVSWMFDRINISETRLSVILDSIDNGYVELNEFGEIVKINEKARNIMEKEFKNLDTVNVRKMLPEELYNKTYRDKQVVRNELVKAAEDDIVISIYPIERAGEFYGVSMIVKNFDEIEKKQHELRRKIVGKGHRAKYTFKSIKGVSGIITESIENAKRMAKSNSSILIEGETGTGKELFAQAIHNESYRKEFPFVAVNCGALPENILESELFGYEEGAFTGARKGGKIGLFELAHKGTIFLDEIGEMPLRLQTKLLRVLQEKEIMKLGSDRLIDVDIRVIAATNKDLHHLVDIKEFREDLYYRIRVLPLKLRPLRERKEDIVVLLDYYKAELGGIFVLDNEAKEIILNHRWKGNSRELRNVVEYFINKEKEVIEISDIPFSVIEDKRAEINKIETNRIIESDNRQKKVKNDSEDYIFVLEELKESFEKKERIGRREIHKRAIYRNLFLSEQGIRTILLNLEKDGFVKIGKGRSGTVITQTGLERLKELKK